MKKTRECLLILSVVALVGLSRHAVVADEPLPKYLDEKLSAEERVSDLVSRLTLDEKVRQMQNAASAIPRLNIPAYEWWNEGLHGVARSGLATVFPQAIGLAAT